MRAALIGNYDAEIISANKRGVIGLVRELETLLDNSVATISVNAKVIRNMALGQNYMSYYRTLDLGLRRIAESMYHAHRAAVDEKIHTGYKLDIVDAALSPDGRGLTNYGEVTMELQPATIEDRASALRENAFDFYERNDLGRRDAKEEPGWRSVWADRAMLGVAHIGPSLTPATAHDELVNHVMFCGSNRQQDRFIEVHIFGEVSWQSLARVTLEKPLTSPEDQEDWEIGQTKLARRGIVVVEKNLP